MRLDQYLVQSGEFRSRDRAKTAILNNGVKVNGKFAKKASIEVLDKDCIEVIKPDSIYVSRGALKLKAALDFFQINVEDKVCLDIGVATGGFSQVLVERGAKKVYAVDIGEGQLEAGLKHEKKLIFRNNTDARTLCLEDFEEKLNLIVVDVSFISILTLLPAFKKIAAGALLVALIKPQFEYGKPHAGVIKDQQLIQAILNKVRAAFLEENFKVIAEMPSPILGKEGNQEYLWLITGNF